MDEHAKRLISQALETNPNGQPQPESPIEPMASMQMPDGSTQVVPLGVGQLMMLQTMANTLVEIRDQFAGLTTKLEELEGRLSPFGFMKKGKADG